MGGTVTASEHTRYILIVDGVHQDGAYDWYYGVTSTANALLKEGHDVAILTITIRWSSDSSTPIVTVDGLLKPRSVTKTEWRAES